MIPTWFLLLMIVLTAILGVSSGMALGGMIAKREIKTPEAKINPFDAYSDAQLETIRKEQAAIVRKYHNRPYYQREFNTATTYLHQINREVDRRTKVSLALESTKADENRRDLEQFENVYGHLLASTEKKEINK